MCTWPKSERQYGSQGYRQHASFIMNSGCSTEGKDRGSGSGNKWTHSLFNSASSPQRFSEMIGYITGRSGTYAWVLGRAWAGLGTGWAICQLINMIRSHLYLAGCHLCKQSHCHTKDLRSKPASYILDVHDINGSFNCIPNSLFRLETAGSHAFYFMLACTAVYFPTSY